jgi:hypothetical protein
MSEDSENPVDIPQMGGRSEMYQMERRLVELEGQVKILWAMLNKKSFPGDVPGSTFVEREIEFVDHVECSDGTLTYTTTRVRVLAEEEEAEE